MNQNINNMSVECLVIGSTGLGLHEAPTALEISLIQGVDSSLKTNPEFLQTYLNAFLVRVECNRMVADNKAGRVYLRYQHSKGVTEFWGHASLKPSLDFKKGQVGVVLEGMKSIQVSPTATNQI